MAKLVGTRIYNSGALTITHNTMTALTFDSERYDYDTMHSTVANTNRITFTTAGVYNVGAQIRWAFHADNVRQLNIRMDGATYIAGESDQAITVDTFVHNQNVNCDYEFTAGQYIEIMVFQNRGDDLDVTVSANMSPEAWAHRIG